MDSSRDNHGVQLTNNRVVAIDGGTATGKGRLIEELSGLLRLHGVGVIHLSTGSIFRAVAYAAMDTVLKLEGKQIADNIASDNSKALDRLRQMNEDEVMRNIRAYDLAMHGGLVWIKGQAASIDHQLKSPSVGTGSSVVAGHMAVRRYMIDITRRQINEFDGFLMIDGRDITHTVVPDAPLKLLLTVSPEVASQRSVEHTLEEIVARDNMDKSRLYGNLRHAHDAGDNVLVISTDHHTPESVRDHVYRLMREVFPVLPVV